MTTTTPFLLFNGNCAEAMQFYADCLGAELTMVTAGESPMASQFPEALRDRIINAKLAKGDIEISASDWFHPTRRPNQGNTVCVYLSGAPYDELRGYFDKLSKDADPDLLDPLQDMPFGAYGALTDMYGVRWMFQGKAKVS